MHPLVIARDKRTEAQWKKFKPALTRFDSVVNQAFATAKAGAFTPAAIARMGAKIVKSLSHWSKALAKLAKATALEEWEFSVKFHLESLQIHTTSITSIKRESLVMLGLVKLADEPPMKRAKREPAEKQISEGPTMKPARIADEASAVSGRISRATKTASDKATESLGIKVKEMTAADKVGLWTHGRRAKAGIAEIKRAARSKGRRTIVVVSNDATTLGAMTAAKVHKKKRKKARLMKMWMTDDSSLSGVCDTCADYDGESIPYNEDFDDGEPPLHPNCRCILLLSSEG